MAKAYLAMSDGSSAGTFHDLIISLFNGHPVTERQEPWINELLSTFQSIGVLAARAVNDGGASARLPMSVRRGRCAATLRRSQTHAPPRTRIHVSGMRCTTCDSRFLLDSTLDSGAAKRWSLFTAPGESRIDAISQPGRRGLQP